MKFTIQRERLLKPLQQVSSSLGSRHGMPILSNLLLRINNDTLFLTGTDLEMELIVRVLLSEPYEAGEITIPARKICDICRSLPERADITMQLEGSHVLVQSGRSRFLLSTLPAVDFPNLESWESEVKFVLPQSTMKQLIETTYFSMAHQDVRYYLNGMLFETEGDQLRTIATDGHRLAVCVMSINVIVPNRSVIVPRRSVIELMRMLNSNNDAKLCVEIGMNNIRAHVGDFIFTSKLLDAHFPDYRCVLQKNSDKMIELDCALLKKAFARVAIILNDKFRGVRLHITKNQLKITANNSEQEEAEETLDIIYSGTEIEIGLNASYILDVLNVLKCENVCILLSDSTSGVQIKDAIAGKATYIIMPMRL